ncbi:MAG: hypothetical protein PHU85_03655 [Phycisphaerae bacterium]|nr:hypothetical protein [Phycisphaerae bacterium]
MPEAPQPTTPEAATRSFGPSHVLNLGTALYVQDDPTEGEATRQAARDFTRHFHELIESVPTASPECVYLGKILAAAVSLSSGIKRRRETRAKMESAAAQKMRNMSGRLLQLEWRRMLLNLALRLVLLAGFGYFFAEAFFPSMKHMQNVEGRTASIATALGVALLGLLVRSLVITYRVGVITRQYTNALDHAKAEYIASARKEYAWAADYACTAWREFTGREPEVLAQNIMVLMTSSAIGGSVDTPRTRPGLRGKLRELLDLVRTGTEKDQPAKRG